MPLLIIACLTLGLQALMSLVANRLPDDRTRLPMQWSLRAGVTWTAIRPLAASATAVLAAFVIGAATFLGAHLLHLALVRRQGKADSHGR